MVLATFQRIIQLFIGLYKLSRGFLFSPKPTSGDEELYRLDEDESDPPHLSSGARTAGERPMWLECTDAAQRQRRAGDYAEAIDSYRDAIAAGEQSGDWDTSAPPAHYANLAELLYHAGRDAEAMAVIDRFHDFQTRHGNDASALTQLKHELAAGSRERLEWLAHREDRLTLETMVSEERIEAGVADLEGIGPVRAEQLHELGYRSLSSVAFAAPKDLMKADGVGIDAAERAINSAIELLTSGSS